MADRSTHRPLRVVLVDTFLPDRRFSMFLFPRCLIDHLPASIEPILVSPNQNGSTRWRRLFDKFVVLPWRIARAAREADLVHVCDTSHAVFLNLPSRRKTLVTVHDLGATREIETMGRVARSWLNLIMRGLTRANALAYVSHQSFEETKRFAGPIRGRGVIGPNSSYQEFPVLTTSEARDMLAPVMPELGDDRFILHIGSNEVRKNRATVVRTLSGLRRRGHDMKLVLAGYPADEKLADLIGELGLSDHVHQLVKPNADMISALYSCAHALTFPSTYEGFGVPVVEAQMNGCPVVCSAIPPHLDILRGTGLVAAAEDVDAFVDHAISLYDPATRADIVERGRDNGARFRPERMASQYAALYAELVT